METACENDKFFDEQGFGPTGGRRQRVEYDDIRARAVLQLRVVSVRYLRSLSSVIVWLGLLFAAHNLWTEGR